MSDPVEHLNEMARLSNGDVLALLATKEVEIERLRKIEAAAEAVLKTFRASEAAGYRSKDRQYAIEVLGKFTNEQLTREDGK